MWTDHQIRASKLKIWKVQNYWEHKCKIYQTIELILKMFTLISVVQKIVFISLLKNQTKISSQSLLFWYTVQSPDLKNIFLNNISVSYDSFFEIFSINIFYEYFRTKHHNSLWLFYFTFFYLVILQNFMHKR